MRVNRSLYSYYLHGQALQVVNHSKYLVVMLTSDATLEAHIHTVARESSSTLGPHSRVSSLKLGVSTLS